MVDLVVLYKTVTPRNTDNNKLSMASAIFRSSIYFYFVFIIHSKTLQNLIKVITETRRVHCYIVFTTTVFLYFIL